MIECGQLEIRWHSAKLSAVISEESDNTGWSMYRIHLCKLSVIHTLAGKIFSPLEYFRSNASSFFVYKVARFRIYPNWVFFFKILKTSSWIYRRRFHMKFDSRLYFPQWEKQCLLPDIQMSRRTHLHFYPTCLFCSLYLITTTFETINCVHNYPDKSIHNFIFPKTILHRVFIAAHRSKPGSLRYSMSFKNKRSTFMFF